MSSFQKKGDSEDGQSDTHDLRVIEQMKTADRLKLEYDVLLLHHVITSRFGSTKELSSSAPTHLIVKQLNGFWNRWNRKLRLRKELPRLKCQEADKFELMKRLFDLVNTDYTLDLQVRRSGRTKQLIEERERLISDILKVKDWAKLRDVSYSIMDAEYSSNPKIEYFVENDSNHKNSNTDNRNNEKSDSYNNNNNNRNTNTKNCNQNKNEGITQYENNDTSSNIRRKKPQNHNSHRRNSQTPSADSYHQNHRELLMASPPSPENIDFDVSPARAYKTITGKRYLNTIDVNEDNTDTTHEQDVLPNRKQQRLDLHDIANTDNNRHEPTYVNKIEGPNRGSIRQDRLDKMSKQVDINRLCNTSNTEPTIIASNNVDEDTRPESPGHATSAQEQTQFSPQSEPKKQTKSKNQKRDRRKSEGDREGMTTKRSKTTLKRTELELKNEIELKQLEIEERERERHFKMEQKKLDIEIQCHRKHQEHTEKYLNLLLSFGKTLEQDSKEIGGVIVRDSQITK